MGSFIAYAPVAPVEPVAPVIPVAPAPVGPAGPGGPCLGVSQLDFASRIGVASRKNSRKIEIRRLFLDTCLKKLKSE